MTSVVLVPGSASGRVRALGLDAGWDVQAGSPRADVESALAAGVAGRPVLFISPAARVPRKLRRILIPHEGTPAPAQGVELADALARVCGAELIVLHVPSFDVAAGHGSLRAPRFIDHPQYDWPAWRREFERRFCRCSDGVKVSLQVAVGEPARSILEVARRLRAELIVLTWKREPRAGRAETLKCVLREAPCPALVVSEQEVVNEAERRDGGA